MKRISVFALAVMLCLVFLMSSVSADTKEEITFRGIPWESSVEDTLSSLKKEFKSGMISNSEFIQASVADEYTYVIHYNIKAPGLKVAGFPVKGDYITDNINLELFFLAKLDESQSSVSEKEGKLVGAKYVNIYSDSMSFDSLSAELEKKLNGLYGSGRSLSSKDGDWNKEWTVNNASITGDIAKMAVTASGMGGFIKVTTYEPEGCSLFYSYNSPEIRQEAKTVRDVYNHAADEKRQQEEKQRQEQQEKEEKERGTDGL